MRWPPGMCQLGFAMNLFFPNLGYRFLPSMPSVSLLLNDSSWTLSLLLPLLTLT